MPRLRKVGKFTVVDQDPEGPERLSNSDNPINFVVNPSGHYATSSTGKRPRLEPINPTSRPLPRPTPIVTPMSKRPAPEPDNDPDDSGNSSSIQRASSSGSSFGHETKLTPLPNHIAIGEPEVTTTKLRFFTQHETNYTSGTTNDDSQDWTFSVNNIQDVLGGIFAGVQTPRAYTHFTSIYEYFSVVGVEYHIKYYLWNFRPGISSRVATAVNESSWDICYRDYGQVGLASYAVTRVDLLQDPQMKHIYLPFRSDTETTGRIDGFLSHEDFVHNIREIKQDANQVRWTKVGATPALVHNMRIMPRRFTPVTVPGSEYVVCDIELIYTVQFKELKKEFKFNQTG